MSSRSMPVDAPDISAPAAEATFGSAAAPVAVDPLHAVPQSVESESVEQLPPTQLPAAQSSAERPERTEPEPPLTGVAADAETFGAVTFGIDVPPADVPPATAGTPADASVPAEDEDEEPTPLAAAVASTTSWLRKATATATAKVSSTYASITRPAPEEDTMTSTERAEFATVGATEATSSWPTADAVRPITTGARPAPGAAVPAPGTAGGARRVRLAVSRVDPWSVMKLSFLLSFALGIIGVVATAVVWFTLDGLHVFAKINDLVTTVAGSASSDQVLSYFSFGKVVAGSMLIGVVDVFLLTAIATIGAFLYNIVAALVGGLHVTMTDD